MKGFILILVCFLSFYESDGLKITTKSKRYTPKVGGKLELPCTVGGRNYNPFMHPVVWFKEDQGKEIQINTGAVISSPFGETGRYSITPNLTTDPSDPSLQLPLILSNISLAENGTYKCVLKSIEHVLSTVTHVVTVAESMHSFTFVSNVTRQNEDSGLAFEFQELEPTYVKCTAKGGNPKPTLRIFREKTDITSEFTLLESESLKGQLGLHVTDYEVELVNPEFRASEDYRGETLKCVAKFHRFTDLRRNIQAMMEVRYGPRFICSGERRVFVDSGPYEIDCLLNANPGVDAEAIVWNIGDEQENATQISTGESWMGMNATAYIDADTGQLRVAMVMSNVTNVTFTKYRIHARNDVGENHFTITVKEELPTIAASTAEPTTEPPEPTFEENDEVIGHNTMGKPEAASGSTASSIALIPLPLVLLAALINLYRL